VFDALVTSAKMGNSSSFAMMTARPQAVGYGLTDSPAGLARGCSCIQASRSGRMAPIPKVPDKRRGA
jgi:hypothetical protein